MLVAIVKAFARPMLGGCGNAVLLQNVDVVSAWRRTVSRSEPKLRVATIELRNAWLMSITGANDQFTPIAAASSPMMREMSAVAWRSSMAARAIGFGTCVPKGRLMREPSRSALTNSGTRAAFCAAAIRARSPSPSGPK
jgi:hypothetical protein